MAEKLCETHNISKKAVTAALLHDCAKELSLEQMISLVGDQFKEDIRGCYNKNILHGYAGAVIAQKELNIQDDQILSAIRYHTTGKKNMNDIEKVVYLSDAIELGRDYENVDKIRKTAMISIDSAIIMEIEYKLKNLESRNIEVHKNTLDFLESLLKG